MIETFALLLFAHMLADFVFQSDWIVVNKRRPPAFLLHIAIVFATALAATGAVADWLLLLALTAAHAVIDAIKLTVSDRLKPFLLDQAAHLITIGALAIHAPDLWATGLWAQTLPPLVTDPIPALAALLAGGIGAVIMGGHAIAKLLDMRERRWLRYRILKGSLPDAGRLIGQLERALAFGLVTAGYPSGVGFLLAAKSVLRFNASKDDRRVAEYVIIGTLASLGWALGAGLATRLLLLELGWFTP
ncbi:DUF3307 domain-containing protein [Aestuariibius sp. 2305UL40-4]|uniref:DUF3307 domain-containing protein n=1 Tax=Aestuariibius violaceus TaxID=3234132 RepID=UPI00345E23A5